MNFSGTKSMGTKNSDTSGTKRFGIISGENNGTMSFSCGDGMFGEPLQINQNK